MPDCIKIPAFVVQNMPPQARFNVAPKLVFFYAPHIIALSYGMVTNTSLSCAQGNTHHYQKTVYDSFFCLDSDRPKRIIGNASLRVTQKQPHP
ncbi:hypothetical protein Ppro_2734 [Pelobacter propionicus DSM 2379]|uniref:Uncharacterized protein n=1 Tax=Pelobacter propionicus (strain DSM 2379 / NBRC 103807 / OttBd1) TaxID=338966 RepID=A1ASL4_PELPD|nr:hypothetical protein Ppro_2734 [Pelobacter propionicus DSM 2379]